MSNSGSILGPSLQQQVEEIMLDDTDDELEEKRLMTFNH